MFAQVSVLVCQAVRVNLSLTDMHVLILIYAPGALQLIAAEMTVLSPNLGQK